jgi:WD40 repeat protein
MTSTSNLPTVHVTKEPFFRVGGAVGLTAPSYIPRRADTQILEALQSGEYCYVFSSRQVGKTTLVLSVAARLRELGVPVLYLDLEAMPKSVTEEQFYERLFKALSFLIVEHDPLLEEKLEEYWHKHEESIPLFRWLEAIRCVVLPNLTGRLIILIDEVDKTRTLSFSKDNSYSDDFFAGIRSFYNARAEDPILARISFCLVGMISAGDLIQDVRNTPFNIGRRIELTDFTEKESAVLSEGLGAGERGKAIIKRVLHWTDGHPYLTQRLCEGVADTIRAGRKVQDSHWEQDVERTHEELAESYSAQSLAIDCKLVDRECGECFWSERGAPDDNLAFVQRYLLESTASDDRQRAKLLNLYGDVLARRRVKDDEADSTVMVLKLSGVVKGDGRGWLQVRNRIYEHVFDARWIRKHMPGEELRRRRADFLRGAVLAAVVVTLILMTIGGLLLKSIATSKAFQSEHASRLGLRYLGEMAHIERAWETGNRDLGLSLLEQTRPSYSVNLEWHFWQQRFRQEKAVLSLKGAVHALAVSPDGLHLAIGDETGNVLVVDPDLRNNVRQFKAHTGSALAVAFTPDGHTLATAGADNGVRLWNVQTGRLLQEFKGHHEAVGAVEIGHSSRCMATGDDEGVVVIWDVHSGHLLSRFKATAADVSALAFSPDDRYLAVTSPKSPTTLWDLRTGKLLVRIAKQLDAGDYSVSFSVDGRAFFCGGADGAVRSWSSPAGKLQWTLHGRSPVTSLAASSMGDLLVAGCKDSSVHLLGAADGRHRSMLVGHEDEVSAAAFCSDGRHFVTGSHDGSTKLWDAYACQPYVLLKGHSRMNTVAFSPDGRWVAAAGGEFVNEAPGDTAIHLWDTFTHKERRLLKHHSQAVLSLAFSSDSQLLLSGGRDQIAVLWSVSSGKILRILPKQPKEIKSVTFMADNRMVTADHDQAAIWTTDSRAIVTIPAHPSEDFTVSTVSLHGNRLLTSGGTRIHLWNAVNGVELHPLTAPLGRQGAETMIYPAIFSTNGYCIAAGGSDGLVRLWRGNEPPVLLRGHTQPVHALAFSSDGTRLLTGGEDKSVHLWDTETGFELFHVEEHTAEVTSVAISPRSDAWATASVDGTILLWDAR